MMITTGQMLPDELILNYLSSLVNRFYKILPLKECNASTLAQYLHSLLRELAGNKSLISALDNDALYLSLLSTLQYMIDNDCDVSIVRTEVFKSINIINKLRKKIERDMR